MSMAPPWLLRYARDPPVEPLDFSPTLLDADAPTVGDWILQLADVAERHARHGDLLAIGEIRDQVAALAEAASGWRMILLDVTVAFLEKLAQSDLTPAELAVRAFLAEAPEFATEVLESMLALRPVQAIKLSGLTARGEALFRRLIDLGVILEDQGRYALSPRHMVTTRDLVEPPAIRLWHQVQVARGHAALNQTKRAEILEGMLGVTSAQVAAHLQRFPLGGRTTAASTYVRPAWTESKPLSADAESTNAPDSFAPAPAPAVSNDPPAPRPRAVRPPSDTNSLDLS